MMYAKYQGSDALLLSSYRFREFTKRTCDDAQKAKLITRKYTEKTETLDLRIELFDSLTN